MSSCANRQRLHALVSGTVFEKSTVETLREQVRASRFSIDRKHHPPPSPPLITVTMKIRMSAVLEL